MLLGGGLHSPSAFLVINVILIIFICISYIYIFFFSGDSSDERKKFNNSFTQASDKGCIP